MEKILELIEEKKYQQVKQELSSLLVPDVADILENIKDDTNLATTFRLLPKNLGAEVFSYIESDLQQRLVELLSDKEIGFIIEELYIDDAVDFIDEMPANVVEKVLKSSTPQTRQTINKLLRYDEDTAGFYMNTEFVDLKSETTVENALERIRKIGKNVETINTLFVTNNERQLTGMLTIRDILLAKPDDMIKDLMHTNYISVDTNCDKEKIAMEFKKYDILSMPVVDKENRLVGIVTIDDVVDIISEEATEDIELMHAITPNDKAYLKTSVFKIWLNRVPWLMLLMISATFTGLIITKNEALLNKSIYGVVLTACIPMLMDTAGNAGGQASATIIRGIALNEISIKDYFKVVWKEFRVSIMLGLSLAVVCYIKLLFIDKLYWTDNGLLVAAIITFAMFLTVIVAKFVGCSLPLIAKQLHLDPAVMASPFITTIIDTLSLLILCGLTTSLLPM